MNIYDSYQSPYSWRYGTPRMREIWGEVNKRKKWRKIWVALAETQMTFGLVEEGQVKALHRHVGDIDVERAQEIEQEIKHDLMAELKVYAEQCPSAKGILHLGATSMDVKDNATALLIQESLSVIIPALKEALRDLTERVEMYAEVPTLGFTHLQPAEPTTLGYRFAVYAQDLWHGLQHLQIIGERFKGKGFTGAVGTSASFHELLGGDRVDAFQERLAEKLGLSFFEVVNQTYPRQQEYMLLSALAAIAAGINKFAFDLRYLQSPPIGEWSEPFAKAQVGSSAMPYKKNPIRAEKVNAIARLLAQYPRVAWDNAALSLLERTLDDSANRRSILPEAFLMMDELVKVFDQIISGMEIYRGRISSNLQAYAPFAATEPLLMRLVTQGADRQEMHERLRQHALRAWAAVQEGDPNPLQGLISSDERILAFLSQEEIEQVMDISAYYGDAPHRAVRLAEEIRADMG